MPTPKDAPYKIAQDQLKKLNKVAYKDTQSVWTREAVQRPSKEPIGGLAPSGPAKPKAFLRQKRG